jgi:uncharacterized protein YigE (DUF2233 family)
MPIDRFRRVVVMLLPLLFPACQTALGATAWRLQQDQELTAAAPALRAVLKSVAGASEVRLYLVLPDPARTRLRVLDNPGNARRLEQAMRDRSCLAGVNGGFFHPDFTPLGLVVSGGRRLHPFERARLLSGLLIVPDRQPRLLRVREFSPATKPSEALQAGPFLIDRGKAVRGLNSTRPAQRTLILADRRGHYGLAVTQSPVTLADLAAILATPGILHELKIVRALNLDGGASTALWVRAPTGENLYLPEWNRVRNFLCVQAVPPPAATGKPAD